MAGSFDQVDVNVGPKPESPKVFVINQNDPKSGKFDEHKVMLGYETAAEAEAAYRANYPADWNGLGSVVETDVKGLKYNDFKFIPNKTPEEAPQAEATNGAAAAAADGVLSNRFYTIRLDPETGAIKPLGPTPGAPSLASTDAISRPFGFDLVTYFGVPHIDRAPTPALRARPAPGGRT